MKAFTNLPLGGSNPPQRTRNTSDRNPASSGEELGHRCMVTNISAPAQTHILKPPVSQSVINRPKQQALSPRLLLPANYEALQVCPPTHTCSQYQTLLLFCNLCSLAIICFLLCEALSQTRTHSHTPKETMEMLLGQLPPVAMTQYTSSVTAHLESREEQQEQEDGEK